MELGIREAVGILSPFLAHQPYTWLQPHSPGKPGAGGTESPGHDLFGDLYFDLDDELLEEAEPEVTYPSCPVVDGSLLQRQVRQRSYQDDGFIYLVIRTGAVLPWIFLGLVLGLLRSCLRPISTPRRDVVIRTARNGDAPASPTQRGRRQSH